MKVVNAIWEKDNIDADTVEIEAEEGDSLDEFSNIIRNVDKEYVVVKIPIGRFEFQTLLLESGFVFVETIFSLTGRINNIALPNFYRRFDKNLVYKIYDDNRKEEVLEEIRAGAIFKTDRIAIDPLFGLEKAGNRYFNWSKRELENGASLNVAYYKDIPVAFGISKIVNGDTCDHFLGGVLRYGEDKGLGFAAISANDFFAKSKNINMVKTKVSSNNPAILKLHLMCGYEIKGMTYVFIKHNGDKYE